LSINIINGEHMHFLEKKEAEWQLEFTCEMCLTAHFFNE